LTLNILPLGAAPKGYAHSISGIICSYTGGTTAGSLTIKDGGTNVIFTVDISAVGVYTFSFLLVKWVQ
jgi:hypothetical protein